MLLITSSEVLHKRRENEYVFIVTEQYIILIMRI